MDFASHKKSDPAVSLERWSHSGVGKIAEAENKILRVILLEDGEVVHNAFLIEDLKELK